jgi:hypothetical protein
MMTQIEGDMASVRVNVLAMHMWVGGNQDARKQDNFFVAGGVIRLACAASTTAGASHLWKMQSNGAPAISKIWLKLGK